MMWFLSLGSRLFNIFGGFGQNIGSFVNNLLNIIQNIIGFIFNFYQNIWNRIYQNPYSFITFLANIWVLMS